MIAANFPRRILYGEGSIQFLETLAFTRVHCIVDQVFHTHNAQVFTELEALFKRKNAQHKTTFGQGQEPSLDFVKEAAGELRAFQPDLLLAIGGGSVLDAAKVMEVYYEHPDITDAQLYDRFNLPPLRRKARFVAIPTTSGTGSEVTPMGVLYVDSGNPAMPHVKRGIADNQMIPDYVILDPAFTLSMPASVTASTGLDAFVHAMEAFVCNKPKNAFADGYALEAMKKVSTYLPLVLREPGNLTYRSEMQIAATMGGLALAGRASGASHAVGKQLATLCPLPHGISVSLMLPAVIRRNAQVRLAEYAEIARYIGVAEKDDQAALEGLLSRLDELLRVARCPRTLSDIKQDEAVFRDKLDILVANALNDAAMKGNPVTLSSGEVREIFESLALPNKV
ncbi:NADPH-dependent butanol dehydrogenase [Deltaproteobacteria bacterium]|nr:NADPH-dependent butanol dehydrogenase [Deltaproteobacteria bacterium]